MSNFFARYREIKNKKEFYGQCVAGVTYLIISLLSTYLANLYAAARASGAVRDLILDNLAPQNVTIIFLGGALFFAVCLLFFGLYRPTRLPFILKSMALLYLIRAFFLILTHLSPPYGEIYIAPTNFLHFMDLGNDLFFSGHTALPFLIALIFWQNVKLRWTFLLLSLFFGGSALLGHLHYSIDVFAAFFITYGIFHIALKIFPDEYNLLRNGEPI